MHEMQSAPRRQKTEKPAEGSKSEKKASVGIAKADPSVVEKSLKNVRADDLQTVFVEQLNYDSTPFSKQPAHKFKQFGGALLTELAISWDDFAALSLAEQEAAVELTRYPPPNGSLAFFAELV
jgi:hypothetical protein